MYSLAIDSRPDTRLVARIPAKPAVGDDRASVTFQGVESGTGAESHGDARHSLTFTSDASGSASSWFLYNAYGAPVGRDAGSPDYGFMRQLPATESRSCATTTVP